MQNHGCSDTNKCPESQESVRHRQTDVCGQRPVPPPRRSCVSTSYSTESTSLSALSPMSSPVSSPVLRTPYKDISSRPPIPVPRTSSMLQILEEPWKQPSMPTSKLKGTSQLLQNPTSNGNYTTLESKDLLLESPLYTALVQNDSGSDTQECPESQVSVKRRQTNVSGHRGLDTQKCPKSQVSVRRRHTDVCGQRPVPAPRRSCMSTSNSTGSTCLSTLSPMSSPVSSPVLRTPYKDISSRPPIPPPRTSQLLQNHTSNGNYTT